MVALLLAAAGVAAGGFAFLTGAKKPAVAPPPPPPSEPQGSLPVGPAPAPRSGPQGFLPVAPPPSEQPVKLPVLSTPPPINVGDVVKTAGSIVAGIGVAIPIIKGGLAALGVGAGAAAAASAATGTAAVTAGAAGSAAAAAAAGGAAGGAAAATTGGAAAGTVTLSSFAGGLSATGIGAIVVAVAAAIASSIALVVTCINNNLNWLEALTDPLRYEKSVHEFERKMALAWFGQTGEKYSEVFVLDPRTAVKGEAFGVRYIITPAVTAGKKWLDAQLAFRQMALEYASARLESGQRLYRHFYPQNILPQQNFDRLAVAKLPLIGGECVSDAWVPFLSMLNAGDPAMTNKHEAASLNPKGKATSANANFARLMGRLNVLTTISKDPTVYALWDLDRYRANVFKAVFDGVPGVELYSNPDAGEGFGAIRVLRSEWPGMPKSGDALISITEVKDKAPGAFKGALTGVTVS